MLVYVKNSEGEPQNPVHPAEARILLKDDLAEIDGYFPFTIKLKEVKEEIIEDNNLYIDLHRDTVDFKVINDNNELVYSSELINKSDIKKNIETRAMLRHSRRSKKKAKSRYRKNKFSKKEIANNIKIPDGWLAPSVKAKFDRIIQEIEFIHSILNIVVIKLKRSNFDINKLSGEDVEWDNLRKYCYNRDKFTCQVCGKKHTKLEGHHINHDHSDNRVENIITLCSDCHHKITWKHPTYDKFLDAELMDKKIKDIDFKSIDGITQVRILFSQLSKIFDTVEYFGYELKKENLYTKCVSLVKRVVGVGHRRLQTYTAPNKKHNFNTKSFKGNYKKGFRNGDLIMYMGKKYYVKGSKTGNAFQLTDCLRDNKVVLERSLNKFKLLHSFGSLPVQETPNTPTTKVMGFLGV